MRTDPRQQWLRILRAEHARRIGGQTIDHRQRNDRLIDEIAARAREAPDWCEPTPEQRQNAFEFFIRKSVW